jgi:hypothetical protein
MTAPVVTNLLVFVLAIVFSHFGRKATCSEKARSRPEGAAAFPKEERKGPGFRLESQ